MKSFSKQNQKGVTLLELMITIFVLSVGIVGIFGLIQNTLQSASLVKSRLTAAYFAQEGIELVRNIRDTNWVQGKSWIDGMPDCTGEFGSGGCEIAFNDPTLVFYTGENLRMDEDGFYGYIGEETDFKRQIIISNNGDYLEVKSIIHWDERGTSYHVEAIEHLYNWR